MDCNKKKIAAYYTFTVKIFEDIGPCRLLSIDFLDGALYVP